MDLVRHSFFGIVEQISIRNNRLPTCKFGGVVDFKQRIFPSQHRVLITVLQPLRYADRKGIQFLMIPSQQDIRPVLHTHRRKPASRECFEEASELIFRQIDHMIFEVIDVPLQLLEVVHEWPDVVPREVEVGK